jgi:hypothetical protein
MILDFSLQHELQLAAGYPWPPQGKWTYYDYCRLPADGRIYEILEVLSPWNWKIDRGKKSRIYAKDGVREHRIVDTVSCLARQNTGSVNPATIIA